MNSILDSFKLQTYSSIFSIYQLKKIDYIHLTNFDLKDKKSHKNKLLLDSMMYLYYNNIINLAKIENLNFENQDNYDILSKSLEI